MNNQTIIDFVNNWRATQGIASTATLDNVQIKQFTLDLQAQVGQLSVRPPEGAGWLPDARPIGYGGYIDGIGAFKYAEAISHSSGGNVFYISDTAAGALLNDVGLQDAVQNTIGGADAAKIQNQIFSGQLSSDGQTRLSRYAVGDVLSLNDFVSDKIVELH